MAGPNQNATVEEILASIRQAISEDDAKRTSERHRIEPRSQPDKRPVASVTNVFADKDAEEKEEAVDQPEDDVPADSGIDQAVIEQAIEQALDGVRAELEGNSRASGRRQAPARPVEANTNVQPAQRAVPRAARPAPMRREVLNPRRVLLSPRVETQVTGQFDDLAKAMIEGNARKLDEVVEQLLRPMLKGWLEGNLPQMVERLVREEIERVSRGRR